MLSSPRVTIGIVAWELVLGVWLIVRYDAFAWLAALGTFTAFAFASGYYGIIGVSNCGCFGAVKTSPWAAFAVDLSALAALLFSRPQTYASISSVSKARWLALSALEILVVGLWVFFECNPSRLAEVRGEKLSLSANYLDFGHGSVGEVLTAPLKITNHSAGPIRIIGGTSDCSCTTTASLPVTLQPGESSAVEIELQIPKSASGQMTRKVVFWTDCESQPELLLKIGCRVD